MKILKVKPSEKAFPAILERLGFGVLSLIQIFSKDYCVKFMLKKQGIFPLSFLRNSLVCNFEDNRRLSRL